MRPLKMTFICGKNWDSMTITPDGRFCDTCNNVVYDFSDKSMEEIHLIKLKQKEVLCGRFLIKPDPVLMAPISTPRPLKLMALLSSIFFSVTLKTVNAQTTDSHQTEQILHTTPKDKKTCRKDTSTTTCDSVLNTLPMNEHPKPIFTTKTKEYYWTKKFPFITKAYKPVKVPTILMGRFL